MVNNAASDQAGMNGEEEYKEGMNGEQESNGELLWGSRAVEGSTRFQVPDVGCVPVYYAFKNSVQRFSRGFGSCRNAATSLARLYVLASI